MWSKQHHDFLLPNIKADVAKRVKCAIVFVEILNLQNQIFHFRSNRFEYKLTG